MIIGLTGGIGAGKSTVASMLVDRGAFVVSADDVAREVVAPGSPGLARLVDAFGVEVLAADGSLDRAELARRVFDDEDQRLRLNAILHPLIAERTGELMASGPAGSIRVHDVALLTELGLAGQYDHVIVVDCPDPIRLRRLVARGLTGAEAGARMAAQATRQQRLAIADTVIDNSRDLETLRDQVDVVWSQLVAPA
ncbi:MAG: dephospho-CoA kinase [Candidatus Nanopelagicales bacterium]|nr:dephospho-CoA kinase [Candidatus Nanopelagicales bacterium]